MRLVHKLSATPLEPETAGRLGACLGRLLSVEVPVAPGFVIEMAGWSLNRSNRLGRALPATITQQMHEAASELDAAERLWVRAAPLSGHGPERWVAHSELAGVVRDVLRAAPLPTAVVVQARAPAPGRGTAVTRDPRRGTVWPSGRFHCGDRTVDLDALTRSRPEMGVRLRSGLGRIESVFKDVCEVSFSLAGERLWFDDVRRLRHSPEAAQQLVDIGLRRRREDVLGSSG
jgi:hypothetical protein